MREIITLLEEKSIPSDIEIIPLNFEDSQVSPVLSKATIDLHYNKLAKGYAQRYNDKEGDRDFNYAGAFLHNMLFPQFREVRNSNKPNGPMKGFVDKHFGSYEDMKLRTKLTNALLKYRAYRYDYSVFPVKEKKNGKGKKKTN